MKIYITGGNYDCIRCSLYAHTEDIGCLLAFKKKISQFFEKALDIIEREEKKKEERQMKIYLCASDEYAYRLANKYKKPILVSYASFKSQKSFDAVCDIMKEKKGHKNVDSDGK